VSAPEKKRSFSRKASGGRERWALELARENERRSKQLMTATRGRRRTQQSQGQQGRDLGWSAVEILC